MRHNKMIRLASAILAALIVAVEILFLGDRKTTWKIPRGEKLWRKDGRFSGTKDI